MSRLEAHGSGLFDRLPMEALLFERNAAIEQQHWWFVARRRIVASLLEQIIGSDPAALVVDIGCGTGSTVDSFSRRWRCVGIDPNPKAIALARRRFPNQDWRCGSAPDAALEEIGHARAVLLMDVLEHVEDDQGFLAGIIRAMRPGAHLLITVPADPGLWSDHDAEHGHFRRYERETLRVLWSGLPVREHLLSPFNVRLRPLVVAARRWGKRSASRPGRDLWVPSRPINALLTRILEGEAKRLSRELRSTSEGSAARRGVSLLAVLEVTPGGLQ